MIKIVSRDLPTSIYANYSTDTSLSESRARQTKDENLSVLEYARQKPRVPIFFKILQVCYIRLIVLPAKGCLQTKSVFWLTDHEQ